MKLHFEPDLDFQHDAIEAVCGLFKSQEIGQTEFTVIGPSDVGQQVLAFGLGNPRRLPDDALLRNLQQVQLHNGLAPSEYLTSRNFTIEMETGTGKTYVYLRTIFELQKRFGFTKFVIVVPSVAIKEGVYKTLEITKDHFRSQYVGVPYEYFLYDSSKLGQVRNFATSPHVQIMVVTVGAINKKDVNNLYKDSEKTGGDSPIDLIKATNPIIIVDEPQTVDGGLEGRGKEALGAMNPLCTLRYSATHVDKHHMVYRLDAVDAYERRLVKQIEVSWAKIEGDHNTPYVRLLETSNKRGAITAKVELDVQLGGTVIRTTKVVGDGDDLEQVTNRLLYADMRIGEISCAKGNAFVELKVPGGVHWLKTDEAFGGVDDDALERLMIRKTIDKHLQKERSLAPQGIKVLSLFFLGSVEHYRSYDADGQAQKGKIALMFEEEYRRLISSPEYRTLFPGIDLESEPAAVHGGYFAIDKKVCTPFEDRELKKSASKEAVDTDTYNLIMKDKERLLSFETKLKFIFSHSALKEGWDNPNVFQICSLREVGTERARRQTVGRGLRLCVNQEGERLRGFDINTLTVIGTESFSEFAEHLQKEIEKDTGIKFGIVAKHEFALVPVTQPDGSAAPLGVETSEAIWEHLRQASYVDTKGNIQDTLRKALKTGTFALPEPYANVQAFVQERLHKLAGKLAIKDGDAATPVKTRRAILDSPEFKGLWDRIKHKTTYRVQFDNEALIKTCISTIQGTPPVTRARLQWRDADLAIGRGGVDATETKVSGPVTIQENVVALPDVLTVLQDRTQLTRRSIVRILTECGRLEDFRKNPQQFIDTVAESINHAKRTALVDGIRYQRIGDEVYYAQELFEEQELRGYLTEMMASSKSAYEYVVLDSPGVEGSFADQLEKNAAVKVYAKLPSWFKVPTPLGNYNPDWAVLVEQDEAERLYFVVETKGSLFASDLRGEEAAKITCGKAHFAALASGDNPATYIQATSIADLMAHTQT